VFDAPFIVSYLPRTDSSRSVAAPSRFPPKYRWGDRGWHPPFWMQLTCARCPAPKCGRWFSRTNGRSDRRLFSHACKVRAWRADCS
jgi:hypothetical protein